MRGRRVLAVIVALLLITGVGIAVVRLVDRRIQLAAVDRHERRWERDRPDDYRYRIEVVCMCYGTRSWLVTVADGRVATVDPDGLDEPRPPTIEELFDMARDAIREGADEVDLEYSERDGHPTRLSVDQMSQSYDDEYAYLVTDFEVSR